MKKYWLDEGVDGGDELLWEGPGWYTFRIEYGKVARTFRVGEDPNEQPSVRNCAEPVWLDEPYGEKEV